MSLLRNRRSWADVIRTRFFNAQVGRWLVLGFVFSVGGLGLIRVFAGWWQWPYGLATFCSGEICTLLRFLAVDRWVFAHPRPTWRRLWQYHVANAAGFAVWWTAANGLKALGVHYILSAIFAMFFSVGFNLLSNFLWVWRKPPAEPHRAS